MFTALAPKLREICFCNTPDLTNPLSGASHSLQSKVDLGHNNDGTVFAQNAPETFYSDISAQAAAELPQNDVTHN
ncbi:alpha/beta-hydrolase [Penicillium riverlandense]|uniref:alpha/beta-hydrolase n=1 Tax=Penicillium riverlandense TaxID=1903569 RepID=UPI0025484933|nr:alpha/beta-hydrolase [Penicillium riverlandense]KAJ5831717.1 alpha/beta-hydrolase [Penicillium riverlandense]